MNSLHRFFRYLRESFRQMMTPPAHQIQALDGVRTLAIFLVVGLHACIAFRESGGASVWLTKIPPFQGGWIGVPLFFILSGYFIGSQLWREVLENGKVAVGRFIFRRGMRIWPLYYFSIVSIGLLYPDFYQSIWSNVFFVANYLGDHGPVRGAWSLSTEEQFYIVMPSLIFFFSVFCGVKKLKTFRYILCALLLVPLISRALTWYHLTGFQFEDLKAYGVYLYRPFHTHCDELIVGLLISNLMKDPEFKLRGLLAKPGWLLIGAFLFAGVLRVTQKHVFTYLALAIAFGSFVWYVLHSEGFVTRFLSHRFFHWTAKVSFGVYIFHSPVMWTYEKMDWVLMAGWRPEAQLLFFFAQIFLISCVVSSFTYVLVEKPFLNLRDRILHGSRSKDLSERERQKVAA